MQKQAIAPFLYNTNIFKCRVAFVAFVAGAQKSANAERIGVILVATLATIILFRIILLLLLLPVTSYSGNTGNKVGATGNKVRNHCCRTFGKNSAIAANGGAKQHWQQKQQGILVLFIGY